MRAASIAPFVVALAACQHATAPGPVRAEIAVFPEAAVERARLAFVLPDPAQPPPRRGFWIRAWRAIAGLEDDRADEAMVRPFGVAALGDGAVLVADPDAPALSRVRRDGARAKIACRGREWVAPIAVASGSDGSIWVADAGAGTVIRMGADGRCAVLGAGILTRPTGIAVAADRVYVADPPAHQVVALSRDGREIARIGGRGEGDGQLSFPSAVALAGDGTLLVVDALNFRIARFGSDGAWRGSFGAPGDEGGAFSRPKGIAVDSTGRIFVTDAQRDALLVFAPDGSFELALGTTGDAPGSFSHPAGVAVAGGVVLVADSFNRRVQGFELTGGAR